MAIFNSFLLGNVKKSVANLTMYGVKGVSIVRGKPLNVRNPRTDKQRVQRAKMALLVQLAKRFRPVFRISYPGIVGLKSGIHCFIQDNLGAVTLDARFQATVDFKKLVCSSDGLKLPKVAVAYRQEDNQFVFTQTVQKRTFSCDTSDVVWVVAYEKVQKETEVYELNTREKGGVTAEELPEDWVAENCEFYAFARNETGTQVSRTSHFTLTGE